ncbi:hypothetical protein DK68_3100 [Brucella suis]|nr:Hypothetical protein BMNI_I0731 [Brucella melitensis NI]AEW13379.1 No hit [Brucella canis HSK A52141]AEW18115.1 Argininosuccinate synthase [Brucella abortus A13334]AIB17469.1 Hypothetical protein BSSP3_I0741 [Brucella suis bv. 2]KFH23205.1 argininosuccinate synthase [Brucella abortus LMN1]KFH25261.1 argininosuccinate synthase [Brucella abortus LMN2]KFJ29282.1 hypothetical protein DK68_3100 [Brucella suis]KFJ58875.1 hypothetical protein DK64_2231 [Brucella neotomae 5K33]
MERWVVVRVVSSARTRIEFQQFCVERFFHYTLDIDQSHVVVVSKAANKIKDFAASWPI